MSLRDNTDIHIKNIPETEVLVADIRIRLEKKGYVLLESEEFPSIHKEEYDFIRNYFENINSLSDKQLQRC